MSEEDYNSKEPSTTNGLTTVTQLVDITANELFAHEETTSDTHKVFIFSLPYFKEYLFEVDEENKEDLLNILIEAQKEKMKELWDNRSSFVHFFS